MVLAPALDARHEPGYTSAMKTAISVPDDVFEAAERTARRLGISRSELYARAVRAFLDDLLRNDVTERLNAVYGETPSPLDPVVGAMQGRALRRNRRREAR